MIDYKVEIDEKMGELFKIKTYSKRGSLTSIRYNKNYISELLNSKRETNNKYTRKKKELAITIKEVK